MECIRVLHHVESIAPGSLRHVGIGTVWHGGSYHRHCFVQLSIFLVLVVHAGGRALMVRFSTGSYLAWRNRDCGSSEDA